MGNPEHKNKVGEPMNQYQFEVGDIVKLAGYKNIFEVIGFLHEIMVMYEERNEQIVYSIRDLETGYTIEKKPDVLQLIRKANESSVLSIKLINATIDEILDKYNDLIYLYQQSNDEYYLSRANQIMSDLKEYFKMSSFKQQ